MKTATRIVILALVVILASSSAIFSQQQSQERIVLFEQFTGTWCGWCPYGHEILGALKSQYGDGMILLVYHARDNLTTEKGDELISFVKPAYPQGTINRVQFPYTEKYPISRGDWQKSVEYMMGSRASIAFEMAEPKYNTENREVSFTLNVSSRRAMEGKYRINVILTEDHILETQKIYAKPYTELKDFYHSNVVRDMVTGAFGESISFTKNVITPANPDARQREVAEYKFEKTFTFKIDTAFIPENCHVVAFVNEDNGDGYGSVLQVSEIDITNLIPRNR